MPTASGQWIRPSESPAGTRQSLLLVDDEPENLEVLEALFDDRYEVRTASNAAQALALICGGLPVDLVIADQRMAGMSGTELLGRIAEKRPDIMRIVLTGHSDVEPMVQALNRGSVYGFVVKPCEPEELRVMVAEALQLKANAGLLRHLIHEQQRRGQALDQTLRELRDTQEQVLAVERVTTVGRAASGIVHNLRNLSTVMCSLMDHIRSDTHDPRLLASAESTVASLESLILLLERVREFARAGDSKPSPHPTDMPLFLQRTIGLAMLEEIGERCPIQLETDSEVRVLSIDPERIAQALLALLDNATRASPPGRPIAVSLRRVCDAGALSRTGKWACIEVTDHGTGMDGPTLDHAVQPFFSGWSPPRLGLGLETVRLAAHAHRGRLELHSEVGSGSTARLLLPWRGELPS